MVYACHAMSCHVISCHVLSCHATHVMPCHTIHIIVSYHVMPRHAGCDVMWDAMSYACHVPSQTIRPGDTLLFYRPDGIAYSDAARTLARVIRIHPHAHAQSHTPHLPCDLDIQIHLEWTHAVSVQHATQPSPALKLHQFMWLEGEDAQLVQQEREREQQQRQQMKQGMGIILPTSAPSASPSPSPAESRVSPPAQYARSSPPPQHLRTSPPPSYSSTHTSYTERIIHASLIPSAHRAAYDEEMTLLADDPCVGHGVVRTVPMLQTRSVCDQAVQTIQYTHDMSVQTQSSGTDASDTTSDARVIIVARHTVDDDDVMRDLERYEQQQQQQQQRQQQQQQQQQQKRSVTTQAKRKRAPQTSTTSHKKRG